MTINRKNIFQSLMQFFSEKTAPLNLAIFRIVVFVQIVNSNFFEVIWLSQFPRELQFPPSGWGSILPIIPVNETLSSVAVMLIHTTAFCALIGLFARTSAWITAALFFYIFGITQCYGKIIHQHHILWFMMILGCSRCGDTLSCDALIRAWRQAKNGNIYSPKPAVQYALPLRFIWLLLGIIYLFPGIWKWWGAGISWALSDNLKFKMYRLWFHDGGWLPIFRVDQHPFIYQPLALSAIIFEISFIILVFFPYLKYFAVMAGLVFHYMANLIFNIQFHSMHIFYIAFVDWQKLLSKIGDLIFPQELFILYDKNHPAARKIIGTLNCLDVLKRITFVDLSNFKTLGQYKLKKFISHSNQFYLSVVDIKNSHDGITGIRIILSRLILLWPLLPITYFWPFSRIFKKNLFRLQTQNYDSGTTNQSVSMDKLQNKLTKNYILITVATVLMIGNIYCGILNIHSWPFSCYPTFAYLHSQASTVVLNMQIFEDENAKINFDKTKFIKKFGIKRFTNFSHIIIQIKNPKIQRQRLKALFWAWSTYEPALTKGKKVQFFIETHSTIPDEYSKSLINQRLLAEFDIKNIAF